MVAVSVRMTWQCISPEVIVKGFKKQCISSTMDGTYNGMLQNDIEQDGIGSSECEEGEGTDCEDGGSDTVW